MTIPTASEMEKTFLRAGQIRKNNPKYANDSTYWEGGRCNWGANHNLKEDCQELERGLGKLESLEKLSEDLRKTTNNGEFSNKKAEYLRKCDESLSKLNNNTAGSCMFGICIIWSDSNMGGNIQRYVEQAKRGVSNLKSALNNVNYDWVEDIKRINLEIRKINEQIRENRQKALNEKDPTKRAKLIELIEEDGKKLIQKETELAKMENRLNFDASSYVNEMIRAMKEAIEGRHNPQARNQNQSRNHRNPRTPDNPHNPYSHSTDPNNSDGESIPSSDFPDDQSPANWWQENQTTLLIGGGIALIAFYFLFNQKETNYY